MASFDELYAKYGSNEDAWVNAYSSGEISSQDYVNGLNRVSAITSGYQNITADPQGNLWGSHPEYGSAIAQSLGGDNLWNGLVPISGTNFPQPSPGDFMYKFTKVGVPLGLMAIGGAAAGTALGGAAAAGEGAGAGAAAGEGAAAGGAAAGAAEGGAAPYFGAEAVTGLQSGGTALPAGAAGGAAAAGVDAGAEPYGGFDAGAVEGADYSGAIGGAGLAGGGVFGTQALSAAGGASGSSGGGSSGGSASGGGLGDSWLVDDRDWMQMLARGVPGLLGAFGAYSQSKDYKDLANQYAGMGAPYRSRLSELYGNPQAFLNSPEVRAPIQQGTDMLARSLSTKGNPAGSGNALQELQNYASTQLFGRLGQEKDRLAGFGGLTAYNQAAPQAATNVINSQKGVYDALGAGFADVFNPPKRYSLQDLLRAY